MQWQKLGLVFGPSEFKEFSTHAQVPTPFLLDDRIRVFYAARNSNGKSFTTYVDLDIDNPKTVLYTHKEPVMGFGEPGSFDDDGVMPSFIIPHGNDLWMYYSGWNQRVSIPYHNSTGLAISSDSGKTFRRMYEGPVMDRTPLEPYVAVTPTIIKESDHFKMWYVSGLRWVLVEKKYEPVYVIKYAHSKDGIEWTRPGNQVIKSNYEMEAFSRPTVFKMYNQYHMYFCCRGSHDYRDGSQGYKFGYAQSNDGLTWQRKDEEVKFSGPTGDWESKMNCYPFYLKTTSGHYLFYNGNGFGQSGFGIAKLEE